MKSTSECRGTNPATALFCGRERGEFFQQIVEQSVDAIVVVDREGIVRYLNRAASALFDRPGEQMLGQMLGFPIQCDGPQEIDIARLGKDSRVAEMRVGKIEIEGEELYLAIIRDITEIALLREELRAKTLVDELTGLYNRRGFLALAEQHLKLARLARTGCYLVFIDVDGLKAINDTYGHEEGGRALTETAEILRQTFRESDILARLGGDEFAVLAIEARKSSSQIISARLEERTRACNGQRKHPFRLSLSVGAARFDPENPCTTDELLARADAMMYEDKRRKRQSS